MKRRFHLLLIIALAVAGLISYGFIRDFNLRMSQLAFHDELSNNQLKKAERLLRKGVDPNLPRPDGLAPLEAAILGGNLEKVELLLRYGANPNQPLTNGSLPLFLARGQRDLCLALVKAGADPNSQSLGFRPIHHAIALGNKEFFSALVELGAEPTMQPGDVESPICYAATSRSIEIARMLIELGADCNAASRTFRSPVAAAIQVGHEEMALELINQGCDVGRLHFYPELMPFVLHYNQLKIGRLLLDRGVDPNEPMRGGAIYHQPLHYAVLNSDEDMVRLLLDYGADVNLVDGQLNTAIDHVVHALQFPGSEPLIPKARLLLEAGGESSRLTMYQVEQILADCENI